MDRLLNTYDLGYISVMNTYESAIKYICSRLLVGEVPQDGCQEHMRDSTSGDGDGAEQTPCHGRGEPLDCGTVGLRRVNMWR